MPKRIVDPFEVIEIDGEHRQRLPRALSAGELLAQTQVEPAPAQEPGQLVFLSSPEQGDHARCPLQMVASARQQFPRMEGFLNEIASTRFEYFDAFLRGKVSRQYDHWNVLHLRHL